MTIREILSRIPDLKVLVIGDIILDHYVWGDVSRISPEAPVPVVEIDNDSYAAGGAANPARNARALGAGCEVCGWIGGDEPGRQLLDMFEDSGVAFDGKLFLRADVPTIRKTRVFVRNQQLCRLDREADRLAYAFDVDACLAPILARIPAFDVVLFSDYAKGFLIDELVEKVTSAAHAADKLVAFDPKPERALRFRKSDLMTPNRVEALKLAGIEIARHEDFPAEAVCDAIWNQYRPKHLVITLGEDGMLLCEDGKVTEAIPTIARAVFDVSGAGDTTIAALALALAAGAGLVDAAHFANAAAGVVVGKVGTATASPAEILEYARGEAVA